MKDLLTCREIEEKKRLTEEDLNGNYIELINKILILNENKNLYLWVKFFNNKEYISDSDKFKILMRSYNN